MTGIWDLENVDVFLLAIALGSRRWAPLTKLRSGAIGSNVGIPWFYSFCWSLSSTGTAVVMAILGQEKSEMQNANQTLERKIYNALLAFEDRRMTFPDPCEYTAHTHNLKSVI